MEIKYDDDDDDDEWMKEIAYCAQKLKKIV